MWRKKFVMCVNSRAFAMHDPRSIFLGLVYATKRERERERERERVSCIKEEDRE